MTYYINKTQARTIARADLTIYDEVNAIMRQVIVDAGNGLYETTIADGTVMTESTPDIVVTGTISNPVIVGTPTLILAGTTIVLGTSGTNLNAIIADINDAAITGLVASKNASDQLVLTYTPTALSWNFIIGPGTANVAVGITTSTVAATNPDSVTYFNVWQGLANDRPKTDQMNQVIFYFENLGYSITRLVNTQTSKTFKWVISY